MLLKSLSFYDETIWLDVVRPGIKKYLVRHANTISRVTAVFVTFVATIPTR